MKSVLSWLKNTISSLVKTLKSQPNGVNLSQESLLMEALPLPRYSLSKRSYKKLEGVHPDLVAVVEIAITITDVDFRVLEGVRTVARQKMLFEAGASKTMNSRHLTGHAVDLGALLNGSISWDWPLYHKIADAMKKAANMAGVQIVWGGDWKTFKDGPHFELDRKHYK